MSELPYKRVLLKLSGEMLAGGSKLGIDDTILREICLELKQAADMGIELAIVVGGGNIFRGLQATGHGMDRVPADHMGMMATIINAVALQNFIGNIGAQARVLSALTIDEVAEPYILRRAVRHLEKGRIVIFAAGTGNPYFTTDTAASLRASEIGAEVLLKGTKVDGVYDKDPMIYDDAVKYERLSYRKVVRDELRVMDLTAITFANDNNLPVQVFDMTTRGNLLKLLQGQKIGTIVARD